MTRGDSSRLPGAAAMAAWLAAACTGAPPPPPAAPTVEVPPPPVVPAATAAASATPSSAPDAAPPDAAPPAMLAMLSAEARAEMEVLAAICPIGVQVKGGKAMAGCLGCPSQSGPDPERLPRVAPPDASLVEPHAHVAGAFTKPGADEHLVMMDSCSCNGCLDEAYLLHREAGGFEVKAKAQVRSSSNCRVVRRRGQVDRPICDRFLARQGYAATTLEMYDFSNLPAEDGSELSPVFGFVALDDLSLSCAPGARFLRRALTSWQLTDVDRDGQDDLVVDLAVGDGVVNRAVFAICAAEEGEAPAKGLPTMRNVKLTWTATASGFRPTAATAAQLKQLDAAKNKAQPQLGE